MRQLCVALLSLAACATTATSTRVAPSASPAPVAPSAPVATASTGEPHLLPFLEDDLGQAVALARQRKVPLFIDAWASW
ncbi:MAG: hypothetical protein QM765_26735 [Myxococcales bacterium]